MRTLVFALSLSAGICLSVSSSFAVTASPFEIFNFDGICTDCTTTSQGRGTLTLTNYTPGTAIVTSNFVQFAYGGDVNYTIMSGPTTMVSGNISSSPGFYNFDLTNLDVQGFITFSTDTTGSWNTGVNRFTNDQGNTGTWNGAAVVSGVPEPSTWAMMLLGFGGLGFLAYRAGAKGSQRSNLVSA